MKDRRQCVKTVRLTKVKVEEHGLKAIFFNREHQTSRINHGNGCLIENAMIADPIVNKVGVGSVIAEFKGTDVSRAYQQLVAISVHKDCKPYIERRTAMLIVCTSWPEKTTTKLWWENDPAKKRYRLTTKTIEIECAIESLFFAERETA